HHKGRSPSASPSALQLPAREGNSEHHLGVETHAVHAPRDVAVEVGFRDVGADVRVHVAQPGADVAQDHVFGGGPGHEHASVDIADVCFHPLHHAGNLPPRTEIPVGGQ